MAIEIRERYGDVVRDRWPVSTDPQPDELLSSWLHRLAIANGIAPRSFATALGLGEGMWSPRLDVRLPRHVAVLLANQTDVPQEMITAMAMTEPALTPLLLPLRENVRRNRSTWMQYCPQCLAGDEAPYFRRQWRLASRISCFAHGCALRDRCPACRGGIASFDQPELVPQHLCARCGYDLRAARKASITTAARRLERAIGDIHQMEIAKGLATISDLVARVVRAPVVVGTNSARSMTSLSTSARIGVFEQLAAEPVDWLVATTNSPIACVRRSIVAAGGHDRLIAGFADFLEKHHGLPRVRVTCPSPDIDLVALFMAYRRVMNTGDGHRRPSNG